MLLLFKKQGKKFNITLHNKKRFETCNSRGYVYPNER